MGDCVFKEEMGRFTGMDYVDMLFNMAGLFRNLALDDTEMALLTALCVFSSGKCKNYISSGWQKELA